MLAIPYHTLQSTIRLKCPNFEKRCGVVCYILKIVSAPSFDHISTGKANILNVSVTLQVKVYDLDVNRESKHHKHQLSCLATAQNKPHPNGSNTAQQRDHPE